MCFEKSLTKKPRYSLLTYLIHVYLQKWSYLYAILFLYNKAKKYLKKKVVKKWQFIFVWCSLKKKRRAKIVTCKTMLLLGRFKQIMNIHCLSNHLVCDEALISVISSHCDELLPVQYHIHQSWVFSLDFLKKKPLGHTRLIIHMYIASKL